MAFQSKLKNMAPRRQQFQRKVKLLSGGYVKPDSFPNGEITVFPWDANIDDWLSERSRKGDQATVLYDLCAQVCDLNGCPLDTFVLGDVNTVLLVSRSIRYNSKVEYECQCPGCGYTTTEVIAIPDELGRVGEKTPEYPGWDEIILPDVQDVVRLRPLQVKDEKLLAQRDEVNKLLMSERIQRILMPIVSINEGRPDGYEDVLRWFQALSPVDSAYLESKEDELYPHLDTNIPHVCDKCRKKFMHPLDFSAEFFRSGVRSKPGAPLAAKTGPGVEREGANAGPDKGAGPNPRPNG